MSGVAAAVKAGYSYKYVNSGSLKKRLGDDLNLALEKAGFTNTFIASKIMKGVEKNKPAIAHKYLETGLKVAGKLQNQATAVNVEKVNVLVYIPNIAPQIDQDQ